MPNLPIPCGLRTLLGVVLALMIAAPPGGCQPETTKACDTRVVEGPTIKEGLVYARSTSMCDEWPQSHMVHLALWRWVGPDKDSFEPQQINRGNEVSWFESCGGSPYPGHDVDCVVVVECISDIYKVVVTVIGVGPDGLPIGDGDGDWDMPEQPRAEIRCPQR